MSDPVLMSKGDLERMGKDMAQVVEVNERLERKLKVMTEERDRALTASNKAKLDLERVRKILPTDKMGEQNEGLKSAISEAHRKINTLENELAAAKAEAETQRRLVAQVNRKFEGIQATFDTLQIARDKAQQDRDKALAELQKYAEAYQKLQKELDALHLRQADALKKGAADAPVKPAPVARPVQA